MRSVFYIDNDNALGDSRQLIKELKPFRVHVRIEEVSLINEILATSVDSFADFVVFFCSSPTSGSQNRYFEYLKRLEPVLHCGLYLLVTAEADYKLYSLKGHKSNLFSTQKSADNLKVIARIIYSTESNGLLSSVKFDNLIRREIEFPPQYKQAGINILSNFAEILDKKYPDMNSKVRITQQGKKVILEIETPEGYKSIAEEELDLYGQVLIGNVSAEEFMGNEDVSLLNNQFLLLSNQMAIQSRELLEYKTEEISNLKDEKRLLLSLVEQSLTASHRQISDQAEIIKLQSEKKDDYQSIISLINACSDNTSKSAELEILEKLKEFQTSDKKGFEKFIKSSTLMLSKASNSFLAEILVKLGASQM